MYTVHSLSISCSVCAKFVIHGLAGRDPEKVRRNSSNYFCRTIKPEKSERTWVPAGWPATSTEAWAATAADLNVSSDEANAEDMAAARSGTDERGLEA